MPRGFAPLFIFFLSCYTLCIQYRINNQITAPELRVLGAQGENLGVLSRAQAFHLAVEAGLDLIEIAPNATPPVARIISHDKFRYQKEKEEKKQRLAQKAKGLKQVRITARAAENDLLIRVRQAEAFLKEGRQVEINLALRGREKGNKEWARKKLEEFLRMITLPHEIIVPPRAGGRGFIAQIGKK